MDTKTLPQKHAITDVSATEPARAKLQQNHEAFQEYLVNLQRLNISVCEADIQNEEDRFLFEEMRILYNELRLFLKNANILVYNRREVHTYLHNKAQEILSEKKVTWWWVWRPLRKSDALHNPSYSDIFSKEDLQKRLISDFSRDSSRLDGIYYPWEDSHGRISWTQYDRMLPKTILYTIEKIAVGFPASRLFVSDFVENKEQKKEQLFASRPDPFLAVAVPRMPFLIVDFWNEPGFHPTQLGG